MSSLIIHHYYLPSLSLLHKSILGTWEELISTQMGCLTPNQQDCPWRQSFPGSGQCTTVVAKKNHRISNWQACTQYRSLRPANSPKYTPMTIKTSYAAASISHWDRFTNGYLTDSKQGKYEWHCVYYDEYLNTKAKEW